jgi:hypothetical protein
MAPPDRGRKKHTNMLYAVIAIVVAIAGSSILMSFLLPLLL